VNYQGPTKWEMTINLKTIDYKVGELDPGSLFGLEELVLDDVARCV